TRPNPRDVSPHSSASGGRAVAARRRAEARGGRGKRTSTPPPEKHTQRLAETHLSTTGTRGSEKEERGTRHRSDPHRRGRGADRRELGTRHTRTDTSQTRQQAAFFSASPAPRTVTGLPYPNGRESRGGAPGSRPTTDNGHLQSSPGKPDHGEVSREGGGRGESTAPHPHRSRCQTESALGAEP
ncbi:hypothetical protein HAX54_013947, partial [Datura stramonium]|nr:hypothetical protein [Datura stramonium]